MRSDQNPVRHWYAGFDIWRPIRIACVDSPIDLTCLAKLKDDYWLIGNHHNSISRYPWGMIIMTVWISRLLLIWVCINLNQIWSLLESNPWYSISNFIYPENLITPLSLFEQGFVQETECLKKTKGVTSTGIDTGTNVRSKCSPHNFHPMQTISARFSIHHEQSLANSWTV